MTLYSPGSRELQDRFDSRRLADRLEERIVRPRLSPDQQAFVESVDCFFLATADAEGRPTCSYKGGDPGFLRVVDDTTLAFPCYDGNGMFLSMGNVLENPAVGLLLVDFERANRMRIQGDASIDLDDPLLADFPEAKFVVRVAVREVFPNCPRYIHRRTLVERSTFVPREGCETPVPDWKRSPLAEGVLPAGDPAAAGAGEVSGPG
jgi:predicted pyridoxine 5'-phosphate oxidase superfamily flavin-nucleotide-binding protein